MSEKLNLIISKSEKIQKLLQDSYPDFCKNFNIQHNHLEIEFEKVYRKIFFGNAKKRYAGRLAIFKNKIIDKISITGFEVVRSDQSVVARKTQKQVFKMLLEDNSTKEEIISYIRKVSDSIKTDKFDCETMGIPTPLKKALCEYKTNIPVVRAVIYSNRHLQLDIRPGEKFLLLYVIRIEGKPDTDVIAIRSNSDVPIGAVIDYSKHSDEATRDKMQRIFDGLSWDLLSLSGQASIMDF